MGLAIAAFVISILGAGGAIWAIMVGVSIATKKPAKREPILPGQYKLTKVAGTEDVFDLELVEEDKKVEEAKKGETKQS